MIIPVETLSTFFITSVLLALTPGPDNIFVLTQSALQGKTAGILIVLGLCTGLIVHTTAVTLGVAVIFQTSELAFTALKLLGAAYLVYLAWGAFRAGTTAIQSEKTETIRGMQLYRRGIIMNVTNPKVSVFFLAFLPQFANPSRGSITLQMLFLGLIFIVSSILVFGAIALTAGTLGEWLNRSEHVQRWMNRTAGFVFVALALKLVVTER